MVFSEAKGSCPWTALMSWSRRPLGFRPRLPPSLRPFWENIGLSATKVAPAPLLLGTSIRNSAPSAGPYLLSSPILAEVTEISFKYVDACLWQFLSIKARASLKILSYIWLNRLLGLSFILYHVFNPPAMPIPHICHGYTGHTRGEKSAMWRNFKFLYICHGEKSGISPHSSCGDNQDFST